MFLLDREKLNPLCGISWNGFNIEGDEKSIKEVQRLMHQEYYVEYFRKRIQELEKIVSSS